MAGRLSDLPLDIWLVLAPFMHIDGAIRLWMATPRLHRCIQSSFSELELDFSSERHYTLHHYVRAFSTISSNPKSFYIRGYQSFSRLNPLHWPLMPKTLLSLNWHAADSILWLLRANANFREHLPLLEHLGATGEGDFDSEPIPAFLESLPSSLKSLDLNISFFHHNAILPIESLEKLPIGLRSVSIKHMVVRGSRMFDLRCHQHLAHLDLLIGNTDPQSSFFDWSYLPPSMTDLNIATTQYPLPPPQAQWNQLFPHLEHLCTHKDTLGGDEQTWPASLTWLEDEEHRTHGPLNSTILVVNVTHITPIISRHLIMMQYLTTLTVAKMKTGDISILPPSLTSLTLTLADFKPVDECIFPKSLLKLCLSFRMPPKHQRFSDFLPNRLLTLKLSTNTSADFDGLLANGALDNDWADPNLDDIVLNASSYRATQQSAELMPLAAKFFDFRDLPYLTSLELQPSYMGEKLYLDSAERLPNSLQELTVGFLEAHSLLLGNTSHLSSLRVFDVPGIIGSLDIIEKLPRGITRLVCQFSTDSAKWTSAHFSAFPPHLRRLTITNGPLFGTASAEDLLALPKSITHIAIKSDPFRVRSEDLPPWIWTIFTQKMYSTPAVARISEISAGDQEYAKVLLK